MGEENQGDRRVQLERRSPSAYQQYQLGTKNTQNTPRDQMFMDDEGLALQMMGGGESNLDF